MNDHKLSHPELASSSRRTFISGLAASAAAVAVPGSVFAAGRSAGAPSAAASRPAASAGKSPMVKLNNGVEMPVFGVGCFALPTIQTA